MRFGHQSTYILVFNVLLSSQFPIILDQGYLRIMFYPIESHDQVIYLMFYGIEPIILGTFIMFIYNTQTYKANIIKYFTLTIKSLYNV